MVSPVIGVDALGRTLWTWAKSLWSESGGVRYPLYLWLISYSMVLGGA